MEKEINEGLETALDYLQDELIPYLKRQIEEKQQRIDKAVEYIKWNLDKNEELIEYFKYDANFNELLNILKGKGDE